MKGRPRWSRRATMVGRAALAGMAMLLASAHAWADGPINLQVVGGLAGVSQYTRLEEPFWRQIGKLTGGRLQAEIHPFDQSGLRGQETLQMMRLGIIPFGTALVAVAAGEKPELNAVDLPALNPDMAALRRTVAAYRPRLQEILHRDYGIELLGIYTYPAQVIYCAQPFTGLDDLKGRRIRTSSVGQSEMMNGLGAIPVVVAYREIMEAVRRHVVDCVLTGTLSGNELGLFTVTTHIHAMAISWGLSLFGANQAAWDSLAPDLQDLLRKGISGLEQDIWLAAERETAEGFACNTGMPDCTMGKPGRMTLVPASARDEATRKRLLVDVVIPDWLRRCGAECATWWNQAMTPLTGITARPE